MKRNSNYIAKSAFPQNMLAMELSWGSYTFKLGKKSLPMPLIDNVLSSKASCFSALYVLSGF
jgi:hypothetical protein